MLKSIAATAVAHIFRIKQMVLRVGFKYKLATCRVKVPAPSRLMMLLLASYGVVAYALPTGGQVVAGNISLQQSNVSTLNIVQGSQRGVINWGSFNVASGERVNFQQPGSSAVTLNRVIGGDLSRIFGRIDATGQVFLINTSGIMFAPGSSVNVSGLVAATLDLSNSNFMSGQYRLSGNGNGLSVVSNAGNIQAGYVVLAGAKVENTGTIVANGGTAALMAGDRVSLNVTGSDLVSVSIDAAAVDAQVRAGGVIQADGGQVIVGARSARSGRAHV